MTLEEASGGSELVPPAWLALAAFSLFKLKKYIFIYFWLHWVCMAVLGLSLVGGAEATLQLWCSGFSLWWLLLLQSEALGRMGFSSCGSQTLEHRLNSCSMRA